MKKMKIFKYTSAIFIILFSLTLLYLNIKRGQHITCEANITSRKNILNDNVLTIHSTAVIFISNHGRGTIRLRGAILDSKNNRLNIDRTQDFSYSDITNSGHYSIKIESETKKVGDSVDNKTLSYFFNVKNDGGDIREISRLGGKALLINNLNTPNFVCLIIE